VNELSQRGRRVAMKLVGYQLLVAVVLATGALLIWDWDTAGSVAAGAGICVLANFVYAKLVFATAGAKAAKNVLRAFYLGEVLKIVLTACLFGLIILSTKTVMLALLLGYLLTQLVFWFALLFVA
jgi:ATP synthase protein I